MRRRTDSSWVSYSSFFYCLAMIFLATMTFSSTRTPGLHPASSSLARPKLSIRCDPEDPKPQSNRAPHGGCFPYRARAQPDDRCEAIRDGFGVFREQSKRSAGVRPTPPRPEPAEQNPLAWFGDGANMSLIGTRTTSGGFGSAPT